MSGVEAEVAFGRILSLSTQARDDVVTRRRGLLFFLNSIIIVEE